MTLYELVVLVVRLLRRGAASAQSPAGNPAYAQTGKAPVLPFPYNAMTCTL